MLQQFTWGQFLLTSFVLSFLWYCFVILFFYRRELFGLFANGAVEPLPHRWEKGVEAIGESGAGGDGMAVDLNSPDPLMGRSALPDGMEVLGMGQLSFSANDRGRYDQVGLVADVIQELKLIFAHLESEAGSKADFFRLLEKVKQDYGKIGAHPNVGAINEFIAAHVPFHLSAEELENLWF